MISRQNISGECSDAMLYLTKPRLRSFYSESRDLFDEKRLVEKTVNDGSETDSGHDSHTDSGSETDSQHSHTDSGSETGSSHTDSGSETDTDNEGKK